jgi:hypothetical protein
MGKINLSRVILGGILTGVIVNISQFLLHTVVLKAEHEETFKALGRTMPTGGSTTMVWVLWGFAWGIAAVWVYAAIRPRFGAGAGTAARAAAAIWFFCCVLSAITTWNLGLLPLSPMQLAWELGQDVLAVVAGAWLYKEPGA